MRFTGRVGARKAVRTLLTFLIAMAIGEAIGFSEPVFIPGHGLNRGSALALAAAAALAGFGALLLPERVRGQRILILLVASGLLLGDVAGWIRRSAEPSKFGVGAECCDSFR